MKTKEMRWKEDLPFELVLRKIDGGVVLRYRTEITDDSSPCTFRWYEEYYDFTDEMGAMLTSVLEFFGEYSREVKLIKVKK